MPGAPRSRLAAVGVSHRIDTGRQRAERVERNQALNEGSLLCFLVEGNELRLKLESSGRHSSTRAVDY